MKTKGIWVAAEGAGGLYLPAPLSEDEALLSTQQGSPTAESVEPVEAAEATVPSTSSAHLLRQPNTQAARSCVGSSSRVTALPTYELLQEEKHDEISQSSQHRLQGGEQLSETDAPGCPPTRPWPRLQPYPT